MKNIMPPINTPDNAFHDGNPATGEQGTIVPGLWLNNIQGATRNIQQELISVLTGAEIEIDETKNNQLLTAILSLITAGIPDLPVASLTQAGIVKLISSLTSDSESLAATAKAVKLVANAIVTSMSDHIQTANPHHQYLAIANLLSEIKGAGPAAVAQTLLNLGLGDAAKRSVGTGVNQIPDMSSFTSSFAQNGYFKFPGGLIIQWGEVTGSTTGTVPANFPIPFPNALMSTALAIDLIG
ncbi:TPA: tail fiber protein, partial [Yersinia enterocolitica]|nr:tail fiber protein [Yersinia enterocolitica]